MITKNNSVASKTNEPYFLRFVEYYFTKYSSTAFCYNQKRNLAKYGKNFVYGTHPVVLPVRIPNEQ